MTAGLCNPDMPDTHKKIRTSLTPIYRCYSFVQEVQKEMDSRWAWLIGILVVLVTLIVLISAGIPCSGTATTNAAGLENTGNLQKNITSIPLLVSSLKGQPPGVVTRPGAGNYRTRLVLLGTAGGPAWWPGTNRTSSSSALVVEDSIYIIDLGQGSTLRLSEAFSSGAQTTDGTSLFLRNAKGLFFTHLHQDHTADYPNLLLIGPTAGLGTSTDPLTNKTINVPLKVFGPGDRGQLEADTSGYIRRGGQVVMSESSDPGTSTATPGIRQMTQNIWHAYAQSLNDMTLDNGGQDYTTLVDVREIGGSGPDDIRLPVSVTDPNNGTCPAMDPFEVYRDDKVLVTAILVDHHQVFPAFAYRFDTADGSVVFSGDTGAGTNGNLERLANGSDVLVHEVIDPAWIDRKFGTPEPGSPMAALKTHMLQSHTSINDVGSVATDCGVRTLVLNHIVPGNTPKEHLLQAQGNFSGTLIIGEDLMQIGIGRTT
jgi:ribonuclease BN (tRNA processing enzyme)